MAKMRARRISGSRWVTRSGSRPSGIARASRSAMPSRRSAWASNMTPPSELIRPPSKAAVIFLRRTAGKQNGRRLSSVMAGVRASIPAKGWLQQPNPTPDQQLTLLPPPLIRPRHEYDRLAFKDEAAAEYDRAFAHVTAYFMPFLLRAADVTPGMRVLDIATGTGLSAAAALAAVGPTGHVAAADVSPAMAERARERLGNAPNASVSVEDGQALSFADSSFDVVLCNLGLMFFPDPVRGLSEFRRVLRPGGRVAVSVNTVVERSYNHQINVIIARHMPSLAEAVTRTFALGEASRLRSLFDEAGLTDIETHAVRHTFVLPSFDVYYGPFERGGASTGQALAALPEEIRRAVREEVRRDLADRGGPIETEAEYRIASARR